MGLCVADPLTLKSLERMRSELPSRVLELFHHRPPFQKNSSTDLITTSSSTTGQTVVNYRDLFTAIRSD